MPYEVDHADELPEAPRPPLRATSARTAPGLRSVVVDQSPGLTDTGVSGIGAIYTQRHARSTT